jgi:hypothetical protein
MGQSGRVIGDGFSWLGVDLVGFGAVAEGAERPPSSAINF